MDKNLFLQVLHRYAASSVDEAQEIVSLKTKFPYSQLLHVLSARMSKDHSFQNQQGELQLAAVYSADRSVLKEVVTAIPEQPIQQIVSKHIDAQQDVEKTLEGVDVADIIMDDLQRLSKLKKTFESLFMGHDTFENPAKEHTKSKKERIIELVKAVNQPQTTGKTVQVDKSKRRVVKNPADDLIEEIKVTKGEITPENEKQKEQIEIINHFIKIQPSISNPKDRTPPPITDLNPIKSGEFGDNIVSETLAEILIKQGKKDKAIEVFKKLIWKYPQKKAYFAQQIESLKV